MPALEVWLMRHGEAQDPDRACADEDRALTPRGRQQVAALARWLAERAEPPQLVLHSPLRRARETAEAFASGFANGLAIQRESTVAPGMRANELLAALRAAGLTRVVCVGHQPDVGRCLAEWTSGGGVQFPPGTLATITFGRELSNGTAALRGVLDPAWFYDR